MGGTAAVPPRRRWAVDAPHLCLKWISTTYSLLLLRHLGLPGDDERGRQSCLLLLDEGQTRDGGINSSRRYQRGETCISGFTIGQLSWFKVGDERAELLVDFLLREQMPDGGWNCRRRRGATHSSFNTTANVLGGLRDYIDCTGVDGPSRASVLEAERRGREFLLAHRLFRSHRTGAVVDAKLLRLTFPPRWRYDILRGLDLFRAAGAPGDERLADALDIVGSKRAPDGRWPLEQPPHRGLVWFEMEKPRQPSRWNTLRALRVLRWANLT